MYDNDNLRGNRAAMALTAMNLLTYVYVSGTMFMKCGNQSIFVKLAAITLT